MLKRTINWKILLTCFENTYYNCFVSGLKGLLTILAYLGCHSLHFLFGRVAFVDSLTLSIAVWCGGSKSSSGGRWKWPNAYMAAPSYYILCIPQQTRPDVLTKYPTSFIKQFHWNFPFKFNNNKRSEIRFNKTFICTKTRPI